MFVVVKKKKEGKGNTNTPKQFVPQLPQITIGCITSCVQTPLGQKKLCQNLPTIPKVWWLYQKEGVHGWANLGYMFMCNHPQLGVI